MVKRKIIWSHRAKIRLYEILKFFVERNKSSVYSEKLYKRFNKELRLLNRHPALGKKTEIENIRGLIIEDYIIFYECTYDSFVVHTIWDCRQNPDNLKLK